MNLHGNEMGAQKQPSHYMANMLLPERVKATRQNPLGPDCIISKTEITDQAILKTMQYYWYISREKGCVECVVKKNRSQEIATTCDPKCVITRKHRRFEAYCCMLCRSNFVTIVQALLHLKALHRSESRILIHDKDIFHNLDKAMEVPPVPLPWHIAKKVEECPSDDMGSTPTFVIPPGAFAPPPFVTLPKSSESSISSSITHVSSDEDASISSSIKNHISLPVPIQRKSPSPNQIGEKGVSKESTATKDSDKEASNDIMISIIKAIAAEFQKPIKHLAFNESCSEVNATFVDGTKITARTPDLSQMTRDNSSDSATDTDMNASVKFFADPADSLKKSNGKGDNRYITLRTNRPVLARKLFASSINVVSVSSNGKKTSPHQVTESGSESDGGSKSLHEEDKRVSGRDGDATLLKPPTNRPVKSVRFMLGAPDSSDEERPETPESSDHRGKKTDGRVKVLNPPTGKGATTGISQEDNADDEDCSFDGLKNVVEDLMSTASKGRILSVSPTSTTLTSSLKPFIPTSSIPLVGSSPALSDMVSASIRPKTNPLTRVQSWSPAAGGTLFSVASMRRPYTARGLTYAEKIELMKQQNDYDAELISKHILPNANASKAKDKKQDEPSSDCDVTAPASQDKYNMKDHEEKKAFSNSDRENSDSDDATPAMLSSVSAMQAAAYSNLLMSSGIFSSEYYGSGEWATTAMEALKTLQSAVQSQEDFDPRPPPPVSISSEDSSRDMMVKTENLDQGSVFEAGEDPFKTRLHESYSDDNATSDSAKDKRFKVKLTNSRKRCKSSTEAVSEEPKSPPKRRKYKKYLSEMNPTYLHSKPFVSSFVNKVPKSEISELTNSELVDGADALHASNPKHPPKQDTLVVSHSSKVPLSPLLNDEERKFILHQNSHRSTTSTDSAPHSKEEYHKDAPTNPIVSRLTSMNMGMKCPSDPALSSSSTTDKCVAHSTALPSVVSSRVTRVKSEVSAKPVHSADQDDSAVLKAGDSLQFSKDVSLVDFDNKEIITTKLISPRKSHSSTPNAKMMNMPEMFRNCIDTCVKIQCVQKIHVCKVCGFSVDATHEGNDNEDKAQIDKAIQAHVMEHSLKELYATGYEMPNW